MSPLFDVIFGIVFLIGGTFFVIMRKKVRFEGPVGVNAMFGREAVPKWQQVLVAILGTMFAGVGVYLLIRSTW